MCGLVGIAGDTFGTWKDLFTDLLVIDSLRGMHSTGAGFVSRDKDKFEVVKRPGHPFHLISTAQYNAELNKPCKIIMGHNRYATMGKHTEENAHPFQFPTVMGAHNGTLDKLCLKDLHNSHKYDTDSQAIFASFNVGDPKEVVSKMSGAWALTWYDKTDGTINFLRNDKRPLHYCYSADRCTLIWASESEMLKLIMARRNRKSEGDQWFFCNPDVHYSWKVPDGINQKFDQPEQNPMKGKTFSWSNYYAGGSHHNPSNYFDDDYDVFGEWDFKTKTYKPHSSIATSTSQSKVIVPAKVVNLFPKPPNLDEIKNFRPPYKDTQGRVLKKVQFEKLVSEGCAFCSDNSAKWGDFVKVLGQIPNNAAFACEACYSKDEINEIAQYAM